MKYIVACMFVCLSSLSFAQPDRVIIHTDGQIELVLRAASAQNVAVGEPNSVPVFTEKTSGALIPGVMYRG